MATGACARLLNPHFDLGRVNTRPSERLVEKVRPDGPDPGRRISRDQIHERTRTSRRDTFTTHR
jgi:hypothetical protein